MDTKFPEAHSVSIPAGASLEFAGVHPILSGFARRVSAIRISDSADQLHQLISQYGQICVEEQLDVGLSVGFFADVVSRHPNVWQYYGAGRPAFPGDHLLLMLKMVPTPTF